MQNLKMEIYWKKCKGVMTLLLPLFLLTVRRSSDLAMAMEARGYTGSGKTSRMYPLVYKKRRPGGIPCDFDIYYRFHNCKDKFLVFLEVMIYNASETNLS